MITKEVNEWMKKVESNQYSIEDALSAFKEFAPFLTKEEAIFIKKRLSEAILKDHRYKS